MSRPSDDPTNDKSLHKVVDPRLEMTSRVLHEVLQHARHDLRHGFRHLQFMAQSLQQKNRRRPEASEGRWDSLLAQINQVEEDVGIFLTLLEVVGCGTRGALNLKDIEVRAKRLIAAFTKTASIDWNVSKTAQGFVSAQLFEKGLVLGLRAILISLRREPDQTIRCRVSVQEHRLFLSFVFKEGPEDSSHPFEQFVDWARLEGLSARLGSAGSLRMIDFDLPIATEDVFDRERW